MTDRNIGLDRSGKQGVTLVAFVLAGHMHAMADRIRIAKSRSSHRKRLSREFSDSVVGRWVIWIMCSSKTITGRVPLVLTHKKTAKGRRSTPDSRHMIRQTSGRPKNYCRQRDAYIAG